MPTGAGVGRVGVSALLGIAQETTLGTFVTATTYLPFVSESLNYTREKILVDELTGTRNSQRQFQGVAKVEGSVELYFNPQSDFCVFLLKHAMGGTVASTTTPTTTSTGRIHTLNEGDMDNNDSSVSASDTPSLSLWVRRGQTNTGAWGFFGCRVNQLTLSGEIGQPVKMTAEIVGISASLTSYAPPSVGFPSNTPVIFNGVSIREAGTIGSAPSATADIFQSFEFTINNNLQSDDSSYALGTHTMMTLPPARRDVTLKLSQRFDTQTAWQKFVDNTVSAIDILLDTPNTMTADAGATTYSARVRLQTCVWESAQPNVGDPGIITHEINAKAYQADTSTNYAVQMVVTNITNGY